MRIGTPAYREQIKTRLVPRRDGRSTKTPRKNAQNAPLARPVLKTRVAQFNEARSNGVAVESLNVDAPASSIFRM
jgi:hypothetical protein